LPIWAGVIPITTVIGNPVASPHLPPGVARPANIAPYTPDTRLDLALSSTHTLYDEGTKTAATRHKTVTQPR
jgi:uncharacterized protein